MKEHGDPQSEANRGLLPITETDFEKIPQIVAEPDRVVLGVKTHDGKDTVGYVKKLDDGTIAYVEEVRTGRNRLAAKTMRKHPAAHDVDRVAANVTLNVRNDGRRAPVTIVRGPVADNITPGEFEGRDVATEDQNAANAQSAGPDASRRTTEEQAQFYADKFAEKLERDPAGAEEAYGQLPGTDGGRILSADDARKLSEYYLGDKTIAPYLQRPATRFIAEIFARRLKEPTAAGRERLVLFTAGGTGAGKSSVLATPEGRVLQAKAGIIVDSTLSSFDRSDEKVQQALAAGHKVAVEYVYRDPVEAFTGGVLKRAMDPGEDGGRPIPLEAHLKTHMGARTTVERLRQKYAGDPRVKFVAVDNSRGEDNARVVPFDHLPAMEENGLRERLQDALQREFEAGRISADVRDRTADTRRYDEAKNSTATDKANPQGRGRI